MNKIKNTNIYSWLLLLLLGLIWGSSYILIKKGLIAYSAEQLASMRISISMLSFLPFFFWRYRKIDWSRWKYFAIIGLTGNFFPAFFFAFAQTEISSSVTGVLSSLTPLFTLLLGLLFYGITFNWNKTVAVAIGLTGAILLILFGNGADFEGNNWYALFVVAGALMYSLSVNTVKNYLNDVDPIDMSIASFMMIGWPAMFYLLSTDFINTLSSHPAGLSSFAYVVVLAVMGTVIASILFYKLVQLTSAVIASMVSYIVPMVAVFWGFADGEPISLFHFIGMALILFGVYISRRG